MRIVDIPLKITFRRYKIAIWINQAKYSMNLGAPLTMAK